jgi:hypothetical protein
MLITCEKRGEGGTSCHPSKDLEKFGHKIPIKNENRGPPHRCTRFEILGGGSRRFLPNFGREGI